MPAGISLSRADFAAFGAAFAALDRDVDRARYATDVRAWAWDRLGIHLWSKQVEIAESIVRRRRTAVQSAAGIGKSFLAAIVSLWWIDIHPLGEAIVVTTAPSAEQVGAILWQEIRKHHAVGGLPGSIQRGVPARWVLGDGTLVGLGRKPPDYNQSAWQGIHRRYVLVIMDEAGGLAEALWAGAEAITTNDDCRILAIGNPDDSASKFATVCQQENLWHTIKVSAWDTPNLTGEWVPDEMRHVLPSAQQVEDLKIEWGVDNPLFIAKVDGDFADSEDGLIPLSWITQAQHRWRAWRDTWDGADESGLWLGASREPTGRRLFGVDPAGRGADKTAIATRQGPIVMGVETWPKTTGPQVEQLVLSRLASHATSRAVLDIDGLGAPIYESLRDTHRANVGGFSGASKTKRRDSTGRYRYFNTRSAAWYHARQVLDPMKNPLVALPPDRSAHDKASLSAQLASPKWPETTGDVITVEPKPMVKARTGRSPDEADAVVIALWEEDVARSDEGRPRPRARQYAASQF